MINLLQETQSWKKPDLKEAIESKLGGEVNETQFSKILKELCKIKAKKWCLKNYDA